jgi:hypothetical protein
VNQDVFGCDFDGFAVIVGCHGGFFEFHGQKLVQTRVHVFFDVFHVPLYGFERFAVELRVSVYDSFCKKLGQ